MQKVQYFFKLLLFLMVESTSTVIFITIESSAKNKNKNDMETRTYFYRVFTTPIKTHLSIPVFGGFCTLRVFPLNTVP